MVQGACFELKISAEVGNFTPCIVGCNAGVVLNPKELSLTSLAGIRTQLEFSAIPDSATSA